MNKNKKEIQKKNDEEETDIDKSEKRKTVKNKN